MPLLYTCSNSSRFLSLFGVFLFILALSGCLSQATLAPVVELNRHFKKKSPSIHVVQKGETLYSVAFRYDKDYQVIARINKLRFPYMLRTGQRLIIYSNLNSRSAPRKRENSSLKHAKKSNINYKYYSGKPVSTWVWPAKGRITSYFSPNHGKKGIDIAGRKGQPVYAAAAGKVAYAGNGLAGYGNLIIIKHENQFLTAYSHNLSNLVKEGQMIGVGQEIGKMGSMRDHWGVHFEIRKAGMPVDPLTYLRK